MQRNCLIIDDNLQDAVIEGLEVKFRSKNINAKCHQFNIGSLERKDLQTDNMIDLAKVEAQFESEFTGMSLELICVDFNLEDAVDGLDILKLLQPLRKSSHFLMYSGNLNLLFHKMMDGYDVDKDRKKLFGKMKSMINDKIVDFVNRDSYDEEIIKWMARNNQSLEMVIEQKLLEYPDLVFEKGYPPLSGKTLEEVAIEIRRATFHSEKYLEEIIEQAVSNMILINS